MNLFYLDPNPQVAAIMQGDKHVVKMILETAQMLSTAHRVLDGEMQIALNVKRNQNGEVISTRKQKRWVLQNETMGLIELEKDRVLYKATHVNHPSSVWIRQSRQNYYWAYDHFIGLCNEYFRRYGKVHLTDHKLRDYLASCPKNISNDTSRFNQPPCCMPDQYKITDCAVTNYRYYYGDAKKKMHKWTKRQPPEWIKEFLDV